jgi:hypothetical protein
MDLVSDLQKRTGFFHTDVMPENIGTKNGELVIHDLGPA